MFKGRVSSLLFAVFATLSVATVAAEPSKVRAGSSAAAVHVVEGKVNLNTADAETLQRELTGIGATKAEAIVEYREANGPFVAVDELLEVKGIGAATLDKNRDKLTIN
ncbi:ComEA family DNA-binding protein [Zestomonas carbonaria]|uniref:Competence protein ComEA n=1 Tax=Zestomonas carbonaria TaxID=2762745 RepID=A0A7U7ERI6_9GAMM|nr:ComEA family DNA-binding protein [Pseudomonas carbonaria]CAD5109726.1 hypothetical protein PSEWESI4_04032 [Pseudomonas carbonaria]